MLALMSAWLGLGCLIVAMGMIAHRPWFTDATVVVVLYSAAGALCLGGLNLWSLRKRESSEAGVGMQRLQCVVGVATALAGAAVVYGLVIAARRVTL